MTARRTVVVAISATEYIAVDRIIANRSSVCEHCRDQYVQTDYRQRFCSISCGQLARYADRSGS